MKKPWFSREYSTGDRESLCELHRLVFGSQFSTERWTWQHQKNPAGPAVIALAESDQGIVGQYALIPLRMKTNNVMCLGSLSLDTMVHPDYRGQGMYVSLARQAYELAERRGIRFVYGFSNENSHPRFTKLGGSDLYNGIPLWVKPLNFESIIKKRFLDNKLIARLGSRAGKITMGLLYDRHSGARGGTAAYSIREAPYFDHRFDSLWEEASRNHNIMVARDKAYLTWRYRQKPGESYTIFTAERGESLSGYIVVKGVPWFDLQVGLLVDIMTAPGELRVARELVSAAVDYFKARQADLVSCLMLPGAPCCRDLKETGFIKAPRGLVPQNMYLDFRSLAPQHAEAPLADSGNWFITWGDHDSI
jgi:predicted N-acetyltransferase YhbS